MKEFEVTYFIYKQGKMTVKAKSAELAKIEVAEEIGLGGHVHYVEEKK
jgi:hypothetical protein